MHQPDPAADLTARKMAHPGDLPRRGSGATGHPATVALTGAPGVGGHALSSEDYQPPLQMQPQPAPGALHPPQTLNLMPLAQSGAQIKKKSGFQITSVTPAQISANMSSNNSIAEDTESYDDLDESHTEDLSSSEILDVSLSRATDLGGPERSSSEETLNNFQEADTPGAVSPNQPHLPQHHLPPHLQQSMMINGNVHHHHHHHHLHHHGHHSTPLHTGLPAVSVPGGPLHNIGSVKPAVTGNSESPVPAAAASTVPSVPAAGHAPQLIRKASGPMSAGVNPTTGGSTISNVNMAGVSVPTMLPSGINVNPSGASSTSAIPGNLNQNILGTSGNGSGVSAGAAAAVGPAAGQQPAAPLAATSRFRVVKLDSSTEPFKKGRWTCMEFYDKENAVPSEAAAAINKAVESIKQNPLEVTSERESTSGSSVSSNISTLSHYTESVGSGEMGTSTTMQQQPGFPGLGPQQMDFSNTVAPNLPQSISQSQLTQLQMHSQDASYSPQKQAGPPAQATLNAATGVQPAPVNLLGVQSSLGHPQPPVSTLIPQQLPYPSQAQPIQSLSAAQQHQLQYAHSQTAPNQMAPGHVMPVNQTSGPGNIPEYLQHPQIMQTAVTPVQSSSTGVANPPSVPVVQAQVMQAPILSSSVQAPAAVAPVQPVAHAQAMPAAGGQVLGVGPPLHMPATVPQAATNQPPSSGLQQGVPIPSQQVLPPSQGIQLGAIGHPPQVIIAPQNTLLPTKPPTQLLEPAVPGMVGQPVPVVSPLHATSGVPPVQQLSTSIPSGMPPAGATLGPLPTVTQPPLAQNGNLVQNLHQAHGIQSVPIAQSLLLSMATGTGQYMIPSLMQSVPSRMEEAQRLEHSAGGVPLVGEGIALEASGAGSLLPLKSLPLSTALVDGEDESSSNASVVAIDNKIEQAMDLVKSHLMYAVREEVEVLKEQIKELIDKNSQLEQENSLLKTLASPEQLAQFQAQLQNGSPPSSSSCSQPPGSAPAPTQPSSQSSGPSV